MEILLLYQVQVRCRTRCRRRSKYKIRRIHFCGTMTILNDLLRFVCAILLLPVPNVVANAAGSARENIGRISSCCYCSSRQRNLPAFVGATSNISMKRHRQVQLRSDFDFHSQPPAFLKNRYSRSSIIQMLSSDSTTNEESNIPLESLLEMDVVVFSRRKSDSGGDDDGSGISSKLELGAIQEDGSLAPISCFTLEDAYGGSGGTDSIEFLVAEEDRFELEPDKVVIRKRVDETMLGFGMRQVGGGKGPGNPHGEESEQVYYIDREFLEVEGIDPVINPDLEILW